MQINTAIYNEIKNNNNIITTAQILGLGYSKTLLTKYVKEGLLERVGHGVYTMPGELVDDMYVLLLRSKNIIFSHDTALFLNGLSDRTPFEHSVTVPSDMVLPEAVRSTCICYYVKPELHSLGMTSKVTTFGNEVRCYNPERTICDIIRSRNRLDNETVISAVKHYAASDIKNLNILAEYTRTFRVNNILKRYLEVLL